MESFRIDSEFRIDKITLNRVLPAVFRGEGAPGSDVWLSGLTFTRPENLLVEARSGGGKSSLISFIYGARIDYDGEILFNGHPVSLLTPGQWQLIRRRHLAWLPQDLMLFSELTAIENIRLKNSLTGNYQGEERIRTWLCELGLEERIDWPAGRLSVGQMQRVAIVRALCQPFDFLLIDEPVSHLDEHNNRIAASIIAEEARRQQAGIIATSVGNPILLDYSSRHSL